jgi:hypothetical protein
MQLMLLKNRLPGINKRGEESDPGIFKNISNYFE